ncbi:2-amino-4-hydroxy-6-hydroxymethyldihydropteridine diphosphokinase [Neorhizobium huautlense]|uniref:2-amino-4-hydroxy-6-hydroxymethyldihydropteridine pyrophosphokinase n=1 Tax=Neorhizobium huautlense TaxID=67774 RepID=A0ABT9PY61_9HYPH|nr:2-amino-4-hydroxy-6-hydroxymethyldihydropteridine diphosphokinase [Neorhizobium huautlense]MDP9839426.1 2-amino-4-hydroxy-6-hydroxymethyldihydropteridine diphosphokinase [Neorhizobium huautlense]
MSTAPDSVWHKATLGLGGNLGDPKASMAEALRLLDGREDCRVLAVSKLYSTPPWGKTDQADFFNCCALIETTLAPEDLLATGLSIEKDMKRERLERWGPRTIDIDVLTYGDVERDTQPLQLPHPRMTERAFVLMPLADIAADQMIKGKPVSSWLALVNADGITVADENRDWWR